jgi:hypothetical protein
MAVCNKTGAIAIYNEAHNLFLSPFADGPILFHTNPDGTFNIKNISKFGRSFSILRIPYSFKLLIQELQTMNIQMRLITDDNVDNLLSLSYSNNINKLLHLNNSNNLKMDITTVQREIQKVLSNVKSQINIPVEIPIDTSSLTPYAPGSPPYAPVSPPYAPDSPPYAPGSPVDVIGSPADITASPPYAPGTPLDVIGSPTDITDYSNDSIKKYESILQVEKPKEEQEENLSDNLNESNNSNEDKIIILQNSNDSINSDLTPQENKKITL